MGTVKMPKYRCWGVATVSITCVVEATSLREAKLKAADFEAEMLTASPAQYHDHDDRWHLHEGSQLNIIEGIDVEHFNELKSSK
jgi:hypothetical protein